MNLSSAKTDDELYLMLDNTLSEQIDGEILKDLNSCLDTVRKKSRALASSLKRCFENARKSRRYVEAYKLGMITDKKMTDEEIEKYLENKLKDFFEKNDFMHYREFVRLLRACTIEVGGEASSRIKVMYQNFFFKKRLIRSFKLGNLIKK